MHIDAPRNLFILLLLGVIDQSKAKLNGLSSYWGSIGRSNGSMVGFMGISYQGWKGRLAFNAKSRWINLDYYIIGGLSPWKFFPPIDNPQIPAFTYVHITILWRRWRRRGLIWSPSWGWPQGCQAGNAARCCLWVRQKNMEKSTSKAGTSTDAASTCIFLDENCAESKATRSVQERLKGKITVKARAWHMARFRSLDRSLQSMQHFKTIQYYAILHLARQHKHSQPRKLHQVWVHWQARPLCWLKHLKR